MTQSEDEASNMLNTIATDIRAQVPPSMQPASCNSSISSTGEEALILTSASQNNPQSSGKLVLTANCSRQGTAAKTPSLKECITVAPAFVSIISTNSIGVKRKADQTTLDQSEPVPSFVNIVSRPSPPLHKNGAKKPRTVSIASTDKPTASSFLLACPEDSQYLNPLHCFVRRNIEVFVATAKDIAAPCPGRKNAVTPGQVGLRCIHCRNIYSRNRTKRALCYPSSVSRVYHCVSDMKFDHFANCKYLPQKEREAFDQLKANCSSKKRGKKVGLGSFNTARYYHNSATQLGLTDGPQSGIVTLCQSVSETSYQSVPQSVLQVQPLTASLAPEVDDSTPKTTPIEKPTNVTREVSPHPLVQKKTLSLPQAPSTNPLSLSPPPELPNFGNSGSPPALPNQSFPLRESIQGAFKSRLLATPGDESVLAPIHCFVRSNVEIFAATPEDVAAPAPGRKTRVTVGQIGIRCIHCAKLSPKQRVKRAVCYPPTILSIYHSVSNMKFDHFGACKGLSVDQKLEFSELRKCSQKGGKKANRKTTARYYIDSAIQDLDLVDTSTGIRPRCEVQQQQVNTSEPILPQVSFANFTQGDCAITSFAAEEKKREPCPTNNGMSVLMMVATDPTMREEYEKRKNLAISSQESHQNTPKVLPI